MRGRTRPTNRVSTAKCFALCSGVYRRLIRSTRPAALLDFGNQRFDRAPTMRPIWSMLDPLFCYVPSVATSVATTWRRAGWAMPTGGDIQGVAADSVATTAVLLH